MIDQTLVFIFVALVFAAFMGGIIGYFLGQETAPARQRRHTDEPQEDAV